jgi:uncharacterized protein (TIGR03435 family)
LKTLTGAQPRVMPVVKTSSDNEAIASQNVGQRLNRAEKFLLSFAGAAALAVPVAVGIGHAPSIHAQSQEKPLAFDAASIKPAPDTPVGGRSAVGNGSIRFMPGRVNGSAVTARGIVLEAYHLAHYQLSGGPAWINSDRFNLEAKTETGADENHLRLMLQTLLAGRFQLEAHRGTAEMPVYALTVGKAGLLIEASRGPSTLPVVGKRPSQGTPEVGAILVQGTVQRLADRLNALPDYFRRPVLDKTGITEVYQFSIGITSWENGMADVEEQSGLKFEPRKATMDTLVIDHIEKPSAN